MMAVPREGQSAGQSAGHLADQGADHRADQEISLEQAMRRARTLLFLYAFVAIVGPSPTAISRSVSKPNILLIVSDDQRPDTIAALGNNVIRTPSLDRLVRRGSTFTRAVCANPICTPSRAEILTGCTGMRNGVFDFGRTIDASLPTLPEPFRDAGYATWYCGKWHNDGRPARHGYESTKRLFTGGGGKWWEPQVDYRGHPVSGYRGWIFRDAQDRPLPELGVGLTPNISERIADAAVEVIDRSTKPFFLHVNFTAPHDPLLLPKDDAFRYEPTEIPLPENFLPEHPFDHGNAGGRDERLLPVPRSEQLVRADLAAYYAVLSHMDAQVGRILESLERSGKRDSTIVIFTSDHGLAMGSHGLRGKQNQYEHTIGVPLLFAGPGIPVGESFDAPIYLRDLFPTLCELAGLPVPDVDGVSHVPVLRGEREKLRDFVVGYFRDSQRMIRTERWKLIRYPLVDRLQLFDLESDPHERNNLSNDPSRRPTVRELSQRLDQWLVRQRTAEKD
jgi:arylsulfatase A-like enzyme